MEALQPICGRAYGAMRRSPKLGAMLPVPRAAVLGLCIGVVFLPLRLEAQRLTPVTDAERCHGERITEVIPRTSRRAVLGNPPGLARIVNGTVAFLQPLTADHVIRNFVLLHAGEACNEDARQDSERILRSQPYISDVAIRALPDGPGAVRLVVETIDEYMIRAQAWGATGVPVGAEFGSANLFGGARGLFVTGEYGRGDALGMGIKYNDYQAFGRPLHLFLWTASRPLARYSGATLQRPFQTDLQPYAWLANVSQARSYYTFHETSIRDVSLEYDARSWALGGLRRWPHDASGFQVGAVATGTYADPIRPVAIRENGPEPVTSPELSARYHAFSALRVGLSGGYRTMRYIQVAGLGALSAVQDVGIGWQTTAMGLQALGVFPNMPVDQVGVWNASGGLGDQFVQASAGVEIEARRSPGTGAEVSTLGSAGAALTMKTSLAHTTLLAVELAGGANSRIPMQLTLRDDDGLLGYRSSDLGGGHRTIWRFEDRWVVPSPFERAEFGVAWLAQAGKLEAGDALFGVTTPWQYGAGFAVLGALPRGSKHMIRLEFGWPLNPAGPRQMEFRISYGDHGASFSGIPGAIAGAREAESAARAVTP